MRKKCSKCSIEKDLSEFHKFKYSKDGKKTICKICISEKNKTPEENHGKWHIDHIKPVSKFDKTEKISIINSLDNLQPL